MISKYHWPEFSKIVIGLLQSGISATTSLLVHSLNVMLQKPMHFIWQGDHNRFSGVFPAQQLLLQTPSTLLTSIVLAFICAFFYKRISNRPI